MKLTKSLSDIVVKSWVVGENGCVRADEAVTFVAVAALTKPCRSDESDVCL